MPESFEDRSLPRDPYFAAVSVDGGDGQFVASPATAGPWSAHLQHGGPPNALAVACAERVVTDTVHPGTLVALRLAAEFVGPVPVGEIETRTRLLRTARSAALVEVVLAAEGRDCLHARVWFVRAADTSGVAPAPDAPQWPVPVDDGGPSPMEIEFGYGKSLDWRFVDGAMRVPGPAAAWARPLTPLLDGYEYSGLARAVLIADSAGGISAELDWDRWSFVNVDLDVHLLRPVEGAWLLMQARTHLGPTGAALARSVLSDAHGVVGAGLQTLVLAPVQQPAKQP